MLTKFNNIKDIKEYYTNTKPFYKEFSLKNKSNNIDIFPYIDNSGDVMLDINSTNTHSEIIKDNINNLSYVIEYLDNLIKQNINIIPKVSKAKASPLPFVFDYNINCYPRGWNGDGGCIHPIFQCWDSSSKIFTYSRKYIIYYIIKHFDIDRWPQPQIFYNYIYNNKLLDFIKAIDKESLNECIRKINNSYDLLDIYNRDISLDENVRLDKNAIKYLNKWSNNLLL